MMNLVIGIWLGGIFGFLLAALLAASHRGEVV
jgi:hypothetical protein